MVEEAFDSLATLGILYLAVGVTTACNQTQPI